MTQEITIDGRAILRQLKKMNGRLKRRFDDDDEWYTLDAADMEKELQETHDGFHVAEAFSGKPITIDCLNVNGFVRATEEEYREHKVYETECGEENFFEEEIAIIKQAKQSIQASIDSLKEFGLLELYQLDSAHIEQIQLDIQWTIDSLEIVNKQMDEELSDVEMDEEKCWDEKGEKLTKHGKQRLKHIHEAVKEIRAYKRETKKKIANLLELINFIGKAIGLKKAISIFDEEKRNDRDGGLEFKREQADLNGREYKSKFEKLIDKPIGFLESIFG